MLDRLIACGMNVTVTLIITLAAGGSLLLGYWGITVLVTDRPLVGGMTVLASVVPAWITLKMARYKNDLVDR